MLAGHAFMTVVGTKNERAQKALTYIGPAVLNGGFSTFLAFILLANSRSHVFMTFFKVTLQTFIPCIDVASVFRNQLTDSALIPGILFGRPIRPFPWACIPPCDSVRHRYVSLYKRL